MATKKLTKPQIVAVAKDVLKQIKARSIKVKTGYYCEPTLATVKALVPGKRVELQDLLKDKKLQNCQVCARGAMVLAKARLFNDCKITIAKNQGDGEWTPDKLWQLHNRQGQFDSFVSVHSDVVFGGLGRAIETGFEGWSEDVLGRKGDWYGPKYKRKYPKAEERLKVLMKNLIRNKGEFKPEQDVKRDD